MASVGGKSIRERQKHCPTALRSAPLGGYTGEKSRLFCAVRAQHQRPSVKFPFEICFQSGYLAALSEDLDVGG
jgi:hypothetical protein